MVRRKKRVVPEYEDDDEKVEPGDDWSEMSPERDPYESDEDYEDRMQSLYGDGWDMWYWLLFLRSGVYPR